MNSGHLDIPWYKKDYPDTSLEDVNFASSTTFKLNNLTSNITFFLIARKEKPNQFSK